MSILCCKTFSIKFVLWQFGANFALAYYVSLVLLVYIGKTFQVISVTLRDRPIYRQSERITVCLYVEKAWVYMLWHFEVVLLYCCPDYPSCLPYMNSISLATWQCEQQKEIQPKHVCVLKIFNRTGEGIVTLYATHNPFRLNKICLNQPHQYKVSRANHYNMSEDTCEELVVAMIDMVCDYAAAALKSVLLLWCLFIGIRIGTSILDTIESCCEYSTIKCYGQKIVYERHIQWCARGVNMLLDMNVRLSRMVWGHSCLWSYYNTLHFEKA